MIITCPNCAARYKVRDDLISDKGKRVKCKKCTAIFRVNQEGESKLEKAPETAPDAPVAEQFKVKVGAPKPKSEEPTGTEDPTQETPKAAPMSAGATVRVDRSQLEDFLKQHQPPAQPDDMPEPPAAFDDMVPPAAPVPEPEPAPEDDLSAGSTVAMDRSALDAFLKEQQKSEVEAEDEPDTASTMAMDRSQLDQFLNNHQPEASLAGGEQGFDVNQDENDSSATMAMDRSQLDQFLNNQGNAAPPDDDSESATVQMDVSEFQDPVSEPTPTPAQEPERVSSHDFEASTSEPAFPSDEELGIEDEKASLTPPVGDADEAFDFNDQTVDQVPATSPPPLANDPFATQPDDQPARELYTARVEGTEYPNLDLEAIERWIREGRLLEQDELAVMGTDAFQAANSFPAVAHYFGQFHGATQAAVQPPEKPQKKGFFAKLFGLFSRKK